jgi:hypothetical protein
MVSYQKTGHMSKKSGMNENLFLILTLFTEGYRNEYYVREIASRLPTRYGTVRTPGQNVVNTQLQDQSRPVDFVESGSHPGDRRVINNV